jgi:hypothetical protein
MSPIDPGFQFWQLPIFGGSGDLLAALCLRLSATPTPSFSTLVANKRLLRIDPWVAHA